MPNMTSAPPQNAAMAATGGALDATPPLMRVPAVRAAVDAILVELRRFQDGITDVRPADPARASAAAAWLQRHNALRGRPTMYPYIGAGIGNGALVQLADGSVKWDMISGIGVHMFGHSDARMVEAAVVGALSDICMGGHLQPNADVLAVADILQTEAARTSALRHCFITNSGCMANENALKVCQQKTGSAPRIIAFADCFMGRSTTMSQIGDTAGYRQGLVQNILVDYMPYYDESLGARSTEIAVWHLKQLVARYPKQHACFVMELVQGEGGFRVAPRSYLEALMRICRESGIPVWADEVQSFGRTECMFAFETLGLGEYIDVATVGKLSQVCACLFREEFNPQPGLLAGTFSSSTSAFHVGRRALETLRDGGYYGPNGRIAALHRAFRERAEDLVRRRPEFFPPVLDSFGRPQPSHVGGTGGMMRLSPLGGSKERLNSLLKAMFDEGVIALTCGHGPYHLRLLPPIGVMEPAQFGPVFEIVERALGKVA
ncbi:MAG: aminotransferase class III-fold pyridoxal phosphate-dependent enzyme [Planctomycetes bacterium]|nr:aminotransferase class III-fold pyridoxal phosphate-dependent enzyme [Planctomycetota bacterium]